jgi:hypothetical protein
MTQARPPQEERDGAMVAHGRRVARALRDRDPGNADGGTGWRGALQTAANQSRQDPEILRIADEIYAAQRDLGSVAGVQVYAEHTLPTVSGLAARSFLHGMLARLELPPGS